MNETPPIVPLAVCNHPLIATCDMCDWAVKIATYPSFDADDIAECGLPLLLTVWDRIR